MPDKILTTPRAEKDNVSRLYEAAPKGLKILDTDRYLKWEAIADFEAHAQQRHSQSLARLADRGGLAVDEIAAILLDMTIDEVRAAMGSIIKNRNLDAIDAALLQRLEEQNKLMPR